MSEPTPEKWAELNDKLAGELKKAEETRAAHLGMARLSMFGTLAMLALIVLLFILLAGNKFLMFIALAPGVLMLIGIALFLRRQKLADQARNEIDRINRDIRAWKKKKPA